MDIVNTKYIKKLLEAVGDEFRTSGIEFLNNIVSPGEISRAEAKYKPMEQSHQGQLQVLEDAKAGKDLAVYYLYKRYLGLTVRIYKQFLGWSDRQDPHIVEEFATRALELLGPGKDIDDEGNIFFKGPHKTWNPEAYKNVTNNSNYLNYFGYYFMNYLKEEAKKMYRKQLKKGGSGSVDGYDDDGLENFDDSNPDATLADPSTNKVAPSVVSYDDFYSNDAEVATEDFSDRVDADVTLKGFEDWLKTHKNEKFQGIFQGLKNGTPINQIAKDLGISNPQMVRNYAEHMRKWAKDFLEGNLK